MGYEAKKDIYLSEPSLNLALSNKYLEVITQFPQPMIFIEKAEVLLYKINKPE